MRSFVFKVNHFLAEVSGEKMVQLNVSLRSMSKLFNMQFNIYDQAWAFGNLSLGHFSCYSFSFYALLPLGHWPSRLGPRNPSKLVCSVDWPTWTRTWSCRLTTFPVSLDSTTTTALPTQNGRPELPRTESLA